MHKINALSTILNRKFLNLETKKKKKGGGKAGEGREERRGGGTVKDRGGGREEEINQTHYFKTMLQNFINPFSFLLHFSVLFFS